MPSRTVRRTPLVAASMRTTMVSQTSLMRPPAAPLPSMRFQLVGPHLWLRTLFRRMPSRLTAGKPQPGTRCQHNCPRRMPHLQLHRLVSQVSCPPSMPPLSKLTSEGYCESPFFSRNIAAWPFCGTLAGVRVCRGDIAASAGQSLRCVYNRKSLGAE